MNDVNVGRQSLAAINGLDGYLRLPDVLRLIPVGRTCWYAGVKKGIYPAPRVLPGTQRAKVYPVKEIRGLIERIERDFQAVQAGRTA
jgi:predicted DNA-binding transcriptional regulator AlpA